MKGCGFAHGLGEKGDVVTIYTRERDGGKKKSDLLGRPSLMAKGEEGKATILRRFSWGGKKRKWSPHFHASKKKSKGGGKRQRGENIGTTFGKRL